MSNVFLKRPAEAATGDELNAILVRLDMEQREAEALHGRLLREGRVLQEAGLCRVFPAWEQQVAYMRRLRMGQLEAWRGEVVRASREARASDGACYAFMVTCVDAWLKFKCSCEVSI